MSGARTRRVLIVSPHFPPVSSADMQRVRMLLPFLGENGWDADVLAVSPDQVHAPRDPWSVPAVPGDVAVHRVHALPRGFSKIPGLGTLGLRALRALATAGDRLLAKGGYDLVYFSTTVFEVHVLGPRWRRRFGVPFVMDYQDAWVSNYYRDHPHAPVPGGRIKYALASALHRWMEPRVLRACAGITSVSPDYPRQIAKRYPDLPALPALVQGFPGAAADFARLPVLQDGEALFDPRDGRVHWVYVGRGGADMATALRGLFRALRDHGDRTLLQTLTLHCIGTSYAAAGSGRLSIMPIAAEFGLQHLIAESPDRINFTRAMWCLKHADALVVPGSDDPAYTASKIYPYLLARRPLLAIFHAASSVVDLIERVGGASCISFTGSTTEPALARDIAAHWLANQAWRRVVPLDIDAFHPYSDAGCAAELTAFFERCLAAAGIKA